MSCDEKDLLDWNTIESANDYKAHRALFYFEWSPKTCWWIIPTLEINTSMKEIALYFFCISVYYSWDRK
jgi:hypothetical protein